MNRMRGYMLAICVISFAVCGMPVYAQQWNDPAYNMNEARRFLVLHNEVRREASVQPLTWSDELAVRAQGLANACTWSDDLQSPTSMMYQGEGNSPNDRSPERAIEAAVRQNRFVVNGQTDHCCSYDAVNTIQHTIRCCRYAKVMNPEFKSLGCGQTICNFTVPPFTFHNVYVAVCFYGNL